MRALRALLPGVVVLALFTDGVGCVHEANLAADKPRAGCAKKSGRTSGKKSPAGKQLQAAPARPGTGATAAKGEARQALGLRREQAVADRIGGSLAREGGRDLKIVTSRGEGVRVDVLGPRGELILVGGPAKAAQRGALGDRLRVLREAAKERGVKAQAFFEEGTADEVLDLARKFLGRENVQTFPKVTR